MRKVQTSVLSIAFLAYLLLERRLFLQLDTGGRGVLPYLDVAMPLLVLVAAILSPRHSLSFVRRRRFWFSCGLYAVLAAAYPFLGLLTGGYSRRHLFIVLEGILPVTFVALGYLLALDRTRGRVLLGRCMFGAIVIQAGYASIQFVSRIGYLRMPLVDWLASWDQLSQLAYSGQYLVGRSTGLYVNPNELGFWSVLAFWAAAVLMSGRRRAIAVIAALITLVLSQSRGSLAALIGTVCVWCLYETLVLGTARRISRRRFVGVLVPAASLLVMTVVLLGVLSTDRSTMPGLAAMRERLLSALGMLSRGVGYDSNFARRLDVWAMVPHFMNSYPLGTFGPPQVMFSAPIDSDYVRIFLQGSVVYLLALIVALLYMASLIKSKRPEARFVGISACALAINAMSALPLTYSSVAVIWTLLGYVLLPAARADGRDTYASDPRGHWPEPPVASLVDGFASDGRGAFETP